VALWFSFSSPSSPPPPASTSMASRARRGTCFTKRRRARTPGRGPRGLEVEASHSCQACGGVGCSLSSLDVSLAHSASRGCSSVSAVVVATAWAPSSSDLDTDTPYPAPSFGCPNPIPYASTLDGGDRGKPRRSRVLPEGKREPAGMLPPQGIPGGCGCLGPIWHLVEQRLGEKHGHASRYRYRFRFRFRNGRGRTRARAVFFRASNFWLCPPLEASVLNPDFALPSPRLGTNVVRSLPGAGESESGGNGQMECSAVSRVVCVLS